MDLAIHCANLTLPGGPAKLGPTLAEVAKTADQGGVRTITLMDHWFQIEQVGPPTDPMLEGYSSLAFLAGVTERIELGLLVTGVTYRHPGLLAKTVTTLDVLSGGRALFGIGAAWYEREHQALGVPYPPLGTRFELLEEAIRIANQMWSDDDGPFEGEHFQLAETLCVPQPLHKPRLLIGGAGEKKTLRLVARYADACNLFDAGVDTVRHKLEVLDGHCETEGRDPSEISRTVLVGADPVHDTDTFLERVAAYGELGVDQVWVVLDAQDPVGWTARLTGDVLPQLASL